MATLYPPFPTSKKPLIFYSNHLRSDLKLVYLQAIKRAKYSIALQIYGLTDPDIIAMLAKKQAEGLDVQIFYDKKASKSLPSHLSAYPMKSGGLMHRKILVIDDSIVLLGTANCTIQSLKMHDNLVLGIWNPELANFLQCSSKEAGQFVLNGFPLATFLLPDFEGRALKALCQRIDGAQKSMQIAMFTLTHPKIIEKIIAAKQRGVIVSIAIDRYTALGASKKHIEALKTASVEIHISQGAQLLHHKWALIDEKIFILGSANWTSSAFEKNQDCLLIFDNLTSHHQKTLKQIWKKVVIVSNKG